MTVAEIISELSLKPISLPEPERSVNGVYIGDLLSWVMGKAESDNVWITIMSNINVIAVASLSDVSCIILSEGVSLDDEVKKVALEKGINVLSSQNSTYEVATKLYGILK